MSSSTLRPRRDELETLLVAASRGDREAFARLYDAVAPRVHGLVLRIVRDPHQAEEVSQEVLLELWQRSSRFDPDRGTALTWILTLTHRRAVDRVRTSEAARRRDAAHADHCSETAYDVTAAAVDSTLETQSIRTALATLSPSQRRAIELAFYSGHTYLEVSHLMQIPLGTAKTRIRDGLRRLRDLMALELAEPA